MNECRLVPKNTGDGWDIREHPEFKKKFETWFSVKVITDSGYRSHIWRNRKYFGEVSGEFMKCLIHEELFDKLLFERRNAEEMNRKDSYSIDYMPKSLGECKEKITHNTKLWNEFLQLASEVNKIRQSNKINKGTVARDDNKKSNTKKLF